MASSKSTTAASLIALSATLPCGSAAFAVPPGALPPARSVPIVRPPAAQTQPTTNQPGAQSGTQPGTQPVAPATQTSQAQQAMQERVAQLARAGATSVMPTFDASMGEKLTKQVVVPVNGGTSTGLLTIPQKVEIGAWFSGSKSPAASASATTPTATSALDTSIPRLQPTAMTPEAVADAMNKFPASEGWQQLWMPDGGKMFVKANPCEAHTLARAMGQLDHPTQDNYRVPVTVNDYAHSVRDTTYTSDGTYRNNAVMPTAYTTPRPAANSTSPPAPAPATTDTSTKNRYALAPDSIAAQIADINSALKVVSDNGRLERALALSQMSLPTGWNDGVKHLAAAYLDNPSLVSSSLDEDFSDAGADTLRKLLGRAVSDANRTGDTQSWIAVAAIMAAQNRPDQGIDMLQRAKKAAADDVTLDRIDELARQLRKLIRATPKS